MEKIIMIKYGELSTKKSNINLFLKQLKENVSFALTDEDVSIKFDKGRMFITLHKDNFNNVLTILKHVFGIHEFHIAYKIHTKDLLEIQNNILKLILQEDFSSFKVVTKRSDKKYPLESMEISRRIGAFILKNTENKKVDVHNPDLTVHVEIRTDGVYLYFNPIKGLGGYPVSVAGKGMLMLSGGIDSPVAGYMAIKRGVKLECLYFESPPHTSIEAKNKVLSLARELAKYNNDIKVHIVRFTDIQQAIYQKCPHEYLITIMRRMMYRIAERIAKQNNAKIIVNGESIGQVASQTLESIAVINEVTKMPVIRPVACFDKLEIIELAEKIGTYQTSILPYEDCCTIFVPEHPVIHPDLKTAVDYENNIPYNDLIEQAIREHEIIKITNKEEAIFSDLL